MEQYKTKNGFTLIEILVSGTILVIAMALIAIFFVKAQKIRVAVMKENNMQVIASDQMMNAAIFGIGQSSDGLMYATEIKDIDPKWIVFSTNGSNYVRLKIGLDKDGITNTLYQQTAPLSGGLPIYDLWEIAITTPSMSIPTRNLDPNDKISLETTGSYFTYYNSSGAVTTTLSEISQVEIRLAVNDNNLLGAPAVILKNLVTLKNIFAN